ncbi:uncharacterized protein LOC142588989 isoform X2 [Dermacentor variabilis]|uniref:uncharacterized protein LOC142588989 isoform X2 n=1 Tax=Dermacentor variabilis TaxID=34621 RepID=UPI003F5C868A
MAKLLLLMLGRTGVLQLYRTSNNWNPIISLCMDSSFIKEENGSYYRTIRYYTPVIRNGRSNLAFRTITLRMTPHNPGHRQPYIHVEEANASEGHSDVKGAPGWFDFKREEDIPVLFANPKCLITGHYSTSGGRTTCTSWVPKEALGNVPDCCEYVLLTLCGIPAYNAYEVEKFLCDALRRQP